MSVICRLCLKSNLEKYNNINADDHRLRILSIIPEIDIDLVDSPVLCLDCSVAILNAYSLKQNCLGIEERLKRYVANTDGKIKLNEFLESEHRTETCLVKEEVLESDNSDAEISELPFQDIYSDNSDKDIKIEKNVCEASTKEKMQCKFCKKTYNGIGRRWADHIRAHLNTNYVCLICSEGFDEKSEYFLHRNEKHQGITGKNKCQTCGKDFLYNANFVRHVKKHKLIDEKHFECNFCGLKLKYREKLTEHLRTHTGERPFKCSLCGKAFAQSSTLSTHIRSIHMTDRPYICEICGRTFPVRGAYTGHMNRHKNVEKNCICSFCGKGYRVESQLKEHVKRHTGVKDFVCHVCSKGFVDNNGLRKHMRIHNGDKPFECHICHKKFTQSYNRKIHVRSCMLRNSSLSVAVTAER